MRYIFTLVSVVSVFILLTSSCTAIDAPSNTRPYTLTSPAALTTSSSATLFSSLSASHEAQFASSSAIHSSSPSASLAARIATSTPLLISTESGQLQRVLYTTLHPFESFRIPPFLVTPAHWYSTFESITLTQLGYVEEGGVVSPIARQYMRIGLLLHIYIAANLILLMCYLTYRAYKAR